MLRRVARIGLFAAVAIAVLAVARASAGARSHHRHHHARRRHRHAAGRQAVHQHAPNGVGTLIPAHKG